MRSTCGGAVSYISPPPDWMPGKEGAGLWFRETDECSASDAIKQLRSAISDGSANARLPDPKDPRRRAIFPPRGNKSIIKDSRPAIADAISGTTGNSQRVKSGAIRKFKRTER